MSHKIAIVTGGAMGIGKAITQLLADEDYYVVIADLNQGEGKKTTDLLGEDRAGFIQCDICKQEDVKHLFATVKEKYRRLDLLVNNAGIIKDNLIWNMPAEDFEAVIDVNLKGTWLMCREAAVLMKEQNYGRIVNITSRAWLGNRGQSNYSASKAGVVALTRVLALELGKYNIAVNAVAPGLIDTPLTQSLEPKVKEFLINAQPTKRMGKPEDVARVVSFLSSENTDFVTGQVLYVDGGKSIGANV